MPKNDIEIVAPLGGIDESTSFQTQPPYTTVYAENVRPLCTCTGRGRITSRPGLSKVYPTELGSGNPIRMMQVIRRSATSGIYSVAEYFDGVDKYLSTRPDWTVSSVLGDGFVIQNLDDRSEARAETSFEREETSVDPSTLSACYATSVGDSIDATNPYTITLRFEVFQNIAANPGSYDYYYSVRIGADDSSDNSTTTITWAIDSATRECHISSTNTSVLIDEDASTPLSIGNHLAIITVNGDSIEFSIPSVSYSASATASPTLTGTVPAIVFPAVSLGGNQSVGAPNFKEMITVYTSLGNDEFDKEALVVSSNGSLYVSNDLENKMSEEDGENPTLVSDRTINAVDFFGKLYIADWSDSLATASDGVVSGSGTSFDSASYSDWTTILASGNNYDYCVNVGGQGALNITSVAAGSLTLDAASGGADDTGLTFDIVRSPKIYDPTASAGSRLTEWFATSGVIPANCPLIAKFSGRIFLAGANKTPYVWYCCRKNDPLDWDFSQTDAESATGGTFTNKATIADDITALIPGGNDYLIFGCKNSMYMMRGDPGAGGSIVSLARDVGVVGANAWCYGPDSSIVFLSSHGLYVVPPGAQSPPVPISEQKLPRQLRDVGDNDEAWLWYDKNDGGVHIFIVNTAARTHWWYDWRTGGYWRVSVDNSFEPTACTVWQPANNEYSSIILGSRDGYLRRFDRSNHLDDGEVFASRCYWGPIRLGGSHEADGMLESVTAVGADDTGVFTMKIFVGDDPEDAYNSQRSGIPQITIELTTEDDELLLLESGETLLGESFKAFGPGRNYRGNYRIRGGAAYIRTCNCYTSVAPWCCESIHIRRGDKGRLKRL